jgi:hypothetical protein
VYVRLAAAWTDPAGVVHGAGDVVDIDPVTLAELEEQGVVYSGDTDKSGDSWTGTTDDPTFDPTYTGPTDDPNYTGPTDDPNYTGPTDDPAYTGPTEDHT